MGGERRPAALGERHHVRGTRDAVGGCRAVGQRPAQPVLDPAEIGALRGDHRAEHRRGKAEAPLPEPGQRPRGRGAEPRARAASG